MALTGLLGTSSSGPGDFQLGNPGSAVAGGTALSGTSAGQATTSGALTVVHAGSTRVGSAGVSVEYVGRQQVGAAGLNVEYGGFVQVSGSGINVEWIPGQTQALTGSSAGQATATGLLGKLRPLTGSSAGQATTSGTFNVLRTLGVGLSAGAATVSGTLRYAAVVRQLVGRADGRATARTVFGKIRRLSGTSRGVATVPRIRIGFTKPRLLTGSSAGRATAAISLLGKRKALAGSTSGRATVQSTLSARRVLTGRTDGVATVTTFLYRPPRLDVFLGIARADSRATATASLSFQRNLVGSSAGTATVSVYGFGQARELAGVAPGVATASAWLALTAVTLPLEPAQTFSTCMGRQIVYAVPARTLVFVALPERELEFAAQRRE